MFDIFEMVTKAILVYLFRKEEFWDIECFQSLFSQPKFSIKWTQMFKILYCLFLADFGVYDGKKKFIEWTKKFH